MRNEKGNTAMRLENSHYLKMVLYFLIPHFSVFHFSFHKKGLPWKEPAIANL
jgi:hypothetical protein